MRILMLGLAAIAVAGLLAITQPDGLFAQEYREATLAVTGMT